MKNQTSQELTLRTANLIVFTLALILSHSLLILVLWILHHYFQLDDKSELGQNIAKVNIIAFILLPIITHFLAVATGGRRKIFVLLIEYQEKKQRERIDTLKRKQEERRLEAENTRTNYMETGYHIKQVSGVHKKPYTFGIELDDPIYKDALPTVKINGAVTPIQILNSKSILSFASDVISTEEKTLNFSVGKNVFPLINPYLMDMSENENILWQNEGHSHQKIILLPKEMFPNANEFVIYGFKMYIGNQLHNSFEGTYDPKIEKIVIPLGNGIYKRQCAGKKVALRTMFGKGNRFVLPKPSILN